MYEAERSVGPGEDGSSSTAHDAFRDRELYRDVQLVVDARNVVAPLVRRGEGGPRRLVKA